MSLVSVPFTFTVGAVIIASQHNSNFSTIYNDYNGNITDANISASAAIANSKLAQITAASKVSGAALTSLASIVAGAGVIPAANLPAVTQFKIITFTFDITTASGTQTVTGVGFTPKAVIFLVGCGAISSATTISSIGIDDGTTPRLICNVTSSNNATMAASLAAVESSSNYKTGLVSSFNSDGFVITFTKVGTPSSQTETASALCFG